MSLLNSFPRFTFSIDPEKDISTFFSFVEDAEYDEGRNLEWAVFKGHSELREYFKYFEKRGQVLFFKKRKIIHHTI